jgi:succinoglycan biosynthesis protein ExoO
MVLQGRPTAKLLVAGSVGRAVGVLPRNARTLGVVDALAPLYREAGVVIAPLKSGSGLKIKLIEALAAGKAVVGTAVSAQGVEPLVAPAMLIADQPEMFACAVLDLLADRPRRLALATAALACVETHFSPRVCYTPLIESLGSDRSA